MQYFKNTDLAKLYPVSEKAVRNWVHSAKAGKLDLALYEAPKRTYIANTPQNIDKIEKIVEARRKYVNKRTHKEITPTKEFYDTYREEHILDIVDSLETHREIPLQYKFFGKSADMWEELMHQQIREEEQSIPFVSPQLLQLNERYIDYIIEPYQRINIICVSAEIFSTLKPFFLMLAEKKVIGRFILVDSSKTMLNTARSCVNEWFEGRMQLEVIERDMQYDRFHDVIVREELRPDADETLNLFLLLGSTIYNFQAPDEALKVVYNSMNGRGILIHDVGLDRGAGRGFKLKFGTDATLSAMDKVIMDQLNIDESFYGIERFYDSKLKQRIIQVRLNVAITLRFQFAAGERAVHLNKDERIVIFRYWHNTTEDVLRMLNRAGFNVLHVSHTKDRAYLMTVADI